MICNRLVWSPENMVVGKVGSGHMDSPECVWVRVLRHHTVLTQTGVGWVAGWFGYSYFIQMTKNQEDASPNGHHGHLLCRPVELTTAQKRLLKTPTVSVVWEEATFSMFQYFILKKQIP